MYEQSDPLTISPLVGFVGKLPAQADFVRQHVADRIGGEFDRWLVKGVQSLLSTKQELPSFPVRFVFSAAQCDSVLVGVMTASRDHVGRSFPLAIYTAIAAPVAARHAQALPLAYEQFLDQAELVAGKADTATAAELRAGIASLSPPSQDVLVAAAQRCHEVLLQTPARDVFARTFPQGVADMHWYGLHTFLVAADSARAAPAGTAPNVLDCPITSDVDLAAWLDLARRCVPTSINCPSFVWVQPYPRLLFVFGHAPEQLLQLVADVRAKSARLWPLVTDRAEAVARSRDMLSTQLGSQLASQPGSQPGSQLGSIEAASGMNVDVLWGSLVRGRP